MARGTRKLNTSGTEEWLRADTLTVDPAYQRAENDPKIRKIMREFNPDAIGVLYVSRRDDGTVVIIDGQQRRAAFLRMGWGDQRLPCMVYSGLTQAEEASLWTDYNELRTKPTPLDRFRADLVAGDPDAVSVQQILDRHNLTFGTATTKRAYVIRSVGAVRTVHQRAGTDVLDQTLDSLNRAWPQSPDAFQGEFIQAVGAVYARFGSRIARNRLVDVLQAEAPDLFIRRAVIRHAESGTGARGAAGNGALTTTVAKMVCENYNQSKPKLAVESMLDWDDKTATIRYWRQEQATTTTDDEV